MNKEKREELIDATLWCVIFSLLVIWWTLLVSVCIKLGIYIIWL